MHAKTLSGFVALVTLAACASAPEAPLASASATSAVAGPVAGEAHPPSQGVVASADPRATAAGEAMLAQGGNEVDAAIAVMLALNVVEPQSSGIGGGGFIVRGTPDGSVETFDGRETAPAAADENWFLDANGKPLPFRDVVQTRLAIGVPGNIPVAKLIHDKYGELEWEALFQPAIRLASEGFVMNARLHSSLDGNIDRAGAELAMRMIFYTDEGEPKPVGTLIQQRELAHTLRQLAEKGPRHLYRGGGSRWFQTGFGNALPRDKGYLTLDDIRDYEAKERDPICGDYRGYKVCGMGPPSSGGVAVIGILEQLERFDLASMGPKSVEAWHLFVEAQRLAYADREIYTGDADFVDIPTQGLIDPDYLARRSQLIDPAERAATVEPGTPPGTPAPTPAGESYPESGTTHFVTIGGDGTMVSYTSTIEGAFGSGWQFGGFYLNNELTDFDFAPSREGMLSANRVQGGKRPRSSMAPTIIYDPQGEPFLALGAAGGSTIPIQTARAIIGVIDFGMGLEEALALPMIMSFGDRVIVEKGSWLEQAIPQLNTLGHASVSTTDFLFRTNGAMRTQNGWVAAYDPRLDGLAYDRHEDTSKLP